jgi:hypothetical protein
MHKYSFSDDILSKYFCTIYLIVSKNLGIYVFFNKIRFFPETKQLTVGKILDLYTTNEALSNVRLKISPYSLLFVSIFLSNRTIRAQFTHALSFGMTENLVESKKNDESKKYRQ